MYSPAICQPNPRLQPFIQSKRDKRTKHLDGLHMTTANNVFHRFSWPFIRAVRRQMRIQTTMLYFSPCTFPNALWRYLYKSSYVLMLLLPLFLALAPRFENSFSAPVQRTSPLIQPRSHTHRQNPQKYLNNLPLNPLNIISRYRMTPRESRTAD